MKPLAEGIGIGGKKCSCCNNGAGKKPSRRKKAWRRLMKHRARQKLKRDSLSHMQEQP